MSPIAVAYQASPKPERCRGPKAAALLVLACTALITGVAASSGDQRWEFQACLRTCVSTGCAQLPSTLLGSGVPVCSSQCPRPNTANSTALPPPPPPSPFLELLQWDCEADCKYLCMWALEESKAPTGGTAPEKYYGKWPFLRLAGAQEPASVVFSAANLGANVACLVAILGAKRRRKVAPADTKAAGIGSSTTLRALWVTHFLLASNAWLWSSVFHCRDTHRTERLDYFSAGALVAFNLFLTLARTVGVSSPATLCLLGVPITLGYVRHVHSMLTVLFDYGKHVKLCIAAGAVQTGAWGVWALATPRGRVHPGRWALLAFMGAVNVAMLLEVLDFPPLWGVLDAHALWHAATAPLTALWFKFVEADVGLGRGGDGGEKPSKLAE